MKGAAYRWTAFVIAVCALSTCALAVEEKEVKVTDGNRLWLNFNREAAVLGNNRFWIELRGTLFQQNGGSHAVAPLSGYGIEGFERERIAKGGYNIDDFTAGRFDLIGAYGLGDHAELGLDFPFLQQQNIDFEVPADCVSPPSNCHRFKEDYGVGDLVLYGKYKHNFRDDWAGALGLEMSIPTGDEDNLMGSGELGLNPFVSTRYVYGRASVGGHLGFLLNTDDQPDVFNWSVSTILAGTSAFAVRLELNGRLFRDFGNTYNDITLYPGIDFNLTENIIIRPEGIAGLTSDAVDWGLGIGFVFTM